MVSSCSASDYVTKFTKPDLQGTLYICFTLLLEETVYIKSCITIKY